jgi:hypothetical protein
MPIRPENAAKYPGGSIRSPEWLAIRERIRERAGDKCENCGVANHAWGQRLADGTFVMADQGIKIVCTVAHVDGKLDDHGDANLAFWCQRCHLRHDAAQHQANAAITRHEKAGQLDLLGRV